MSVDTKLTPDQIAARQEILIDTTRLIGQRIAAGFHTLVGESEDVYRRDYETAVESLLARPYPNGSPRLSLVEPRVPLKEQVERLGALVDLSIVKFPHHHRFRQPYGAWIGIVRNPNSLLPNELLENIPIDSEPADAFEGAGSDLRGLTRSGFSFVAGDGESVGSRLCFDTWKGLPRLTKVAHNIADSATGLLVKYI